MISDGRFADPWEEGEPRGCKLTFIGRNLDHAALRQGFMDTMHTEENLAKRIKTLRFAIGDSVECSVGEGVDKWAKGTVVNHLWRDDSFPPGLTVPYQIKLDDGDLIYAPGDDDELIRKA